MQASRQLVDSWHTQPPLLLLAGARVLALGHYHYTSNYQIKCNNYYRSKSSSAAVLPVFTWHIYTTRYTE